MSFVSTLPAATVRFSSSALAPTFIDKGRGEDRVTLLSTLLLLRDTGTALEPAPLLLASVATIDAGLGEEPATGIFLPVVPRRPDLSFTYGLPALTFLFGYAFIPFPVKAGDLILPYHHNVFAVYWRPIVARLKDLREVIAVRRPDLVEEYDAAVAVMDSLVSNVPTVERGDEVRGEHYNVRIAILDAFLPILRMVIVDVLGAPEDLAEWLEEVEKEVGQLEKRGAGDLITASDYNAVVHATREVGALFKEVERRLASL